MCFVFFSFSLRSVLPLLQPGAAAPHPDTLNASRARTLSPSRHPAGTRGDLGSDKRKTASPRPAQNSLKSPCQPRCSSLRSSQALFFPLPQCLPLPVPAVRCPGHPLLLSLAREGAQWLGKLVEGPFGCLWPCRARRLAADPTGGRLP